MWSSRSDQGRSGTSGLRLVYSGLNVGDRVYASVPAGGCADTVWADKHLVAPLPDSLDFAAGAALVVNDHTAHVAFIRRAGLRPGESVLVHGAAGGLGSAAVRIAAALGARVTAVASTPNRRSASKAAGAERAYGPDEWLDAVRGAGGADVIVDRVGGGTCSMPPCGHWRRRAGPGAVSRRGRLAVDPDGEVW